MPSIVLRAGHTEERIRIQYQGGFLQQAEVSQTSEPQTTECTYNSTENLVKLQVLIQYLWDRLEFSFLISSQVIFTPFTLKFTTQSVILRPGKWVGFQFKDTC